MISVLIPVEAWEPGLVETIAALVPAVADGVVRDLVLIGPPDFEPLAAIADAAGCLLVHGEGSRSAMIALGAGHARCDHVLVLPPGLIPGMPLFAELAELIDTLPTNNAYMIPTAPRRGRTGAVTRLKSAFTAWRQGVLYPFQGVLASRLALQNGLSSLRIFARSAGHLVDRRSL